MKNKKNIDELVEKLDFIDVYINATHLNYVNGNNLYYNLDAVKNGGGESWLKPYPKPQLLHHDKTKDAVGRIVDYSIKDKALIDGEPKDYVQLKSRITDKDAISKVLKGIYYTCSVGSSSTEIRCSVCDQVLTRDGLCEHEKGSMVDGQKVYWIIDEITYKENSFVNNPADSYSRIVSIDIGDGPMEYEKFLKDKEQIIKQFIMEDDMKTSNTDAKLSTESRKKLPDSAFCGPGRSFPANDKAHVTAGLRLLNKSKFSQSTKDKIKACLYRKGKRYNIGPSEDELKEDADFLVYRMDDDFTEDEIKVVEDFFKENPTSLDDEVKAITEESSDNEEDNSDSEEISYDIDDFETIKKGKKDEIIAFADFIITKFNELSDSETILKDEINELKDKISEQDTILISKEDEINKLLDSNADLTVKYKRSLIDSILDFKKIIENRDEEYEKYKSRKIDSLLDTLEDCRNEHINDIPKVEDETLTDSTESDNNTSENTLEDDDSHEESKIDRFFKHNIITED